MNEARLSKVSHILCGRRHVSGTRRHEGIQAVSLLPLHRAQFSSAQLGSGCTLSRAQISAAAAGAGQAGQLFEWSSAAHRCGREALKSGTIRSVSSRCECVCVCVCVCLCWCSLTAHSARPKSITVVPKKSKQAGAQRWAEKGSEEGKSGKKLAANCWAAFDCCSLLNGFRHCATGAMQGEVGGGGGGRKQAERHKRSSDIAFVSMNFVNNF